MNYTDDRDIERELDDPGKYCFGVPEDVKIRVNEKVAQTPETVGEKEPTACACKRGKISVVIIVIGDDFNVCFGRKNNSSKKQEQELVAEIHAK